MWASSSLATITITITVESPRHHILLFALLHQSSPLRCVRQEGIITSNVLPDRRRTTLMLVVTRVALAGTKALLLSPPVRQDVIPSYFHHSFITHSSASQMPPEVALKDDMTILE